MTAAQVLWPAAAEAIELLKRGHWTIATCESMTGGGIGAALTSVAGSSAVFRGGLITYATDLKVALAGVDADFVAANGVINRRTAEEMAVGTARVCRADVGLSVTGVAGPDGEDGAAPGTVWLGLALPVTRDDRVRARLLELDGDRAEIRTRTVAAALTWLSDCLRESPRA